MYEDKISIITDYISECEAVLKKKDTDEAEKLENEILAKVSGEIKKV